MEIMLSHLGVGVAYDALDGLDIHAQRLHLRHIGVAAAVRREQADIARFFQRFAEHIPEMGGIAGQAGLGAFPDELVGGIPQLDGTRADIQRHRNIPDTVFGFRTADADCTFYDLYVIGKAADVFGEKIYESTPALDTALQDLTDAPAPAKEEHLEPLKKSITKEIITPMVEQAKQEYGRDLKLSDQKRFESTAKAKMDVAVNKVVDLLEQENPGCFDDPGKVFLDPYMKSGLYITEIVKRLYRSEKMRKAFPDDNARLEHIFAKQVYGLAPTEIIYRIAISYILGFAKGHGITAHHIRQADTLEFAKAGTMERELDKIFRD